MGYLINQEAHSMIDEKMPGIAQQRTEDFPDQDSALSGIHPCQDRVGSSLAGGLMRALLHRLGDPAIQIVLWNDEAICTSSRAPSVSVRIGDRLTLLKLI